ncbi:mitochondrial fission ELM1 family protein [Silanimonas sp.]|uniref:mitochondrial fission ELM1 family protein n=1 Tax=Silanimonas sp. TaxID=1929290 RepID=UPI001BBA4286|nr:mitochondrial fission ELM1 family protein [Silanimonas sp.]MBS3895909.1 mitochondrial fission ELM1 family protein [Silanimonas sp.]
MPSPLPADLPAVLLLHDGAAGNQRQVSALAGALGLPATELPLLARRPWAWAAPRRWPGSRLAFGAAFAALLDTPPALAFGCGRQAALATRLLRERGTRVVQVLDPRLPPRHWDLLVAPHHDGLCAANVLNLHGSLHPVDTAWLVATRAAWPLGGAAAAPRRALLVGAPTRACRWDATSLDAALDRLREAQSREGGTVWATASRRTPPELVALLRQRLAGWGQVWAATSDGPNPYPGWLAWADALVVTPDSANLLSEAAATAAPLWIIAPEQAGGRLRGLIDQLLSSGRARPLAALLPPWPVQPWNETARLAAALATRLGLQPPEGSAAHAAAIAAAASST